MLRLMKVLAPVVAAILSCCTFPAMAQDHGPALDLHADTDFTQPERDQIMAAARMWSYQTGGLANIQVTFDLDFHSIHSLRLHQDDDVLIRWEEDMAAVAAADCNASKAAGLPCGPGGPRVLGLTALSSSARTRVALIPQRTPGSLLATVAMHEFGHAIDLDHGGEPGDVMFHSHTYGDKPCLSRRDLVNFCSVHQCRGRQLRYCL